MTFPDTFGERAREFSIIAQEQGKSTEWASNVAFKALEFALDENDVDEVLASRWAYIQLDEFCRKRAFRDVP